LITGPAEDNDDEEGQDEDEDDGEDEGHRPPLGRGQRSIRLLIARAWSLGGSWSLGGRWSLGGAWSLIRCATCAGRSSTQGT
jgi:hypothetical protein